MKEFEKVYVTPEMEMTSFDAKDVIATSNGEVRFPRTWLISDTPFCPMKN